MAGPQNEDERELQLLLRQLAGRVIVGLIALIVVVAVFTPLLTDSALDTALVLGLVASLIGALLTLAGFVVSNRNGR